MEGLLVSYRSNDALIACLLDLYYSKKRERSIKGEVGNAPHEPSDQVFGFLSQAAGLSLIVAYMLRYSFVHGPIN